MPFKGTHKQANVPTCCMIAAPEPTRASDRDGAVERWADGEADDGRLAGSAIVRANPLLGREKTDADGADAESPCLSGGARIDVRKANLLPRGTVRLGSQEYREPHVTLCVTQKPLNVASQPSRALRNIV